MDEHNSYGIDFIEAVREIKTLSLRTNKWWNKQCILFFRGNNLVRGHACLLLYHAKQVWMWGS